jgi:hypothetical protein
VRDLPSVGCQGCGEPPRVSPPAYVPPSPLPLVEWGAQGSSLPQDEALAEQAAEEARRDCDLIVALGTLVSSDHAFMLKLTSLVDAHLEGVRAEEGNVAALETRGRVGL